MHRRERIEQQITETIGKLIVSRQIKDPRVDTLASVSRVSVSKDFAFARVYITGFLKETSLKKTVEGLNSASGFVQMKLAHVLNTRMTPKLTFFVDTSLAQGFEVMQKLNDQ